VIGIVVFYIVAGALLAGVAWGANRLMTVSGAVGLRILVTALTATFPILAAPLLWLALGASAADFRDPKFAAAVLAFLPFLLATAPASVLGARWLR